jgi:hypothetical protein
METFHKNKCSLGISIVGAMFEPQALTLMSGATTLGLTTQNKTILSSKLSTTTLNGSVIANDIQDEEYISEFN